jgi:hypothetical protein
LGAIIAAEYNVEAPDSFYEHHDMDAMQSYLEASDRFELVDAVPQADHIWIPATGEKAEDGWLAAKWAVASLPYGPDKVTGKSIVNKQFLDYLDERIKPKRFDPKAEANDGFYVDTVVQKYFVCRAIK